jgi:hypothetical protein
MKGDRAQEGQMTTMTRSSTGVWLTLLIVLALVVTVGMIGLDGLDFPTATPSGVEVSGAPEVITNAVPAYVEEQIAYGERATSDINPSARILPVYMIEAITYGEMEPPTG